MTISQQEKIRLALQAADEKKSLDPVALDLQSLSAVTDFFIIAGGGSDTQVRAVADGVVKKLAENEIEPLGSEGYNEGTWVLLDYGDFVVHIFHRDKRIYYDLEGLWSDAPRIRIGDLKEKKRSRKKP